MDYLVNLQIQYDLELLRREALQRQILKQAGLIKPPLYDRILTWTGEVLIKIGMKLKEMPERKLITEEASVPTFLIML